MTWALFLDDYRWPEDTKAGVRNDWMIARNYQDAVNLVTEYGPPIFISFDHDLADEHYGMSAKELETAEKTGYSFAKWFCDHVIDNNLELSPEFTYYVHSMNPVGAENIRKYMDNFIRHYR